MSADKDSEEIALLAIESLMGSLNSIAETQKAMLELLDDLVKEMKRGRQNSRK